jgi:hypothetical protein
MTLKEIINSVIAIFPSIAILVVSLISYRRDKAMAAEISQLKIQLKANTEIPLTLKNGVYYDKDGNAFCPACHGSTPKQYVPLSDFTHYDRKSVSYHCPKCDMYLIKPSHTT